MVPQLSFKWHFKILICKFQEMGIKRIVRLLSTWRVLRAFYMELYSQVYVKASQTPCHARVEDLFILVTLISNMVFLCEIHSLQFKKLIRPQLLHIYLKIHIQQVKNKCYDSTKLPWLFLHAMPQCRYEESLIYRCLNYEI